MNTKLIFDFLKQLSNNNNREWFNKHKDLYLQAKSEVESFIDRLGGELIKMDPVLQGHTDPQQVLFRIYRDIRFSKDKSPYKTHFGCYFAPGGKSSFQPGYYVHLEAGNTLLSGGVWSPEPSLLKHIRQEIYYNAENLIMILENPQFKKIYPGLDSHEMLKRVPSGFPLDFEHEKLLRYKHYTVSHQLTEKILFSDNLEEVILESFKILKPFNEFFREAMRLN